jgi:adenosine deaminase
LNVTLHAGEWGSVENIREAIEVFQADRIGHGVRVLESPAVSALAAERGIPFEVCLSSNIHSGIFPSRADHPFRRMLAAGINASLHSDDPSISGITLADEYLFALQDQQLTRSQLEQSVLSAAQAAFLPQAEKQALLRRLRIELDLLEES